MHREIVVHMHHGILFTCKEKRSPEVSRKQIKLEKIILSVVIQTQKDKHWILFFIGSSQLQIFRYEYIAWSNYRIFLNIKAGLTGYAIEFSVLGN